ncbi:MAG: hypothetical protein NC548_46040 [Lachnospiraceae bacterium]|nr:hypothetical protein [Lachnospiraceae bacterium]
MEQVLATLQDAVVTLACAGITTLAVMAVAYLAKLRKKAEAEIDKIVDEDTQILAQDILDRTFSTLSICIDKMEVTLVKAIKRANDDGKLTKEDGERVAQEAIDLFYDIVDQDVAEGLTLVVQDVQKYLLTLVDSLVLEKKKELLKAGINPGVTSGSVPSEQALLNS